MKKFLSCLCLSLAPFVAHAQAHGLTLDLDDQNPLSKWGRWTYLDYQDKGIGLNLSQNRNRLPLMAHWQKGDLVFKWNRDVMSSDHDLFFGLRLREDQLATTSLGCMSNGHKSAAYKGPLCGVQLDVNLK